MTFLILIFSLLHWSGTKLKYLKGKSVSDLNNEHPKDILIHKSFTQVLLTILHNLFFADVVRLFHQVRKCSAIVTD